MKVLLVYGDGREQEINAHDEVKNIMVDRVAIGQILTEGHPKTIAFHNFNRTDEFVGDNRVFRETDG